MSCQKIYSGGQTGVDRGALDAAIEVGFPCGGWCPEERMAEDGPINEKYPLKILRGGTYSDRTKKNIDDSDGTLIIYSGNLSGGTKLTLQYALAIKKPYYVIKDKFDKEGTVQNILTWIQSNGIRILNIAGPRKSEWEDGYLVTKTIISRVLNYVMR